ncbi:MAG: hypothetical protein JXB36_02190 [Gammaproteobacteria bacterium]|nr:hypothetical protein [Gammaproteobacteria bacterium]
MKSETSTTRRRFFFKAGAALSAPLAVAAAGTPGGDGENPAALEARLRRLEDVEAIRALSRRLARLVDAGARTDAARLFVEPAGAEIDDRVRGISLDESDRDQIEVSADRATARLHCTVRLETPIEPRCPLVDMAAQQGGGIVRRTESGVLENVYVKRRGKWKIQRSVYRS